jgi:2-polyprenyl-6-methoxyphenol hydroxylase-like FAD-dependent oxidoreductase
MRVTDMTVVVVGGATGGAAAALLLARAGAPVTLLEKVAQPQAVGAGIAIAENGLAVLESLGLGPAVATVSQPVSAVRIVDAHGRALFVPPGPEPVVRMMRRSALQSVLLDALAAEPLIDCRFGVEVTDVTAQGDVMARAGSSGVRLHADLVVGADGFHSQVRARGGFGARIGGSGITYVRALVREGLATGVEAWTPAGLFGSFPVPDGTYVYASAGSPVCRRAVNQADLASFRAAWASAYPASAPVLDAVARWDDLLVNRVWSVHCPRWANGRLVLLGDAAHAMPPNLGQGANSALVDAAVLLHELRRQGDVASALASYQARRQPAVAWVSSTAARLGRLAELTHPMARLLRDRVLMPVAQRRSRASDLAAVMQEPSDVLHAIGRT